VRKGKKKNGTAGGQREKAARGKKGRASFVKGTNRSASVNWRCTGIYPA
jgi:hypothetical protein